MKKVLLAVFILFDLLLVGGCIFVLATYVGRHAARKSPVVPRAVSTSPTPVQSASSTTAMSGAGSPLAVPAAPEDSLTRKILFSYRNSHSRKVSIRADFTGWKAEPMQKDDSGGWTYLAHLTPGEYAYCYTADDKTFKDPANKRTKQIGRTMVSSIVVTPLTPPKP